MGNVVVRKCPHCGAAVQVDPAAQQPYNVTCTFCRTTITIMPHVARPAHGPVMQPPMGPNVIVLDKGGGAKTGAGCLALVFILPVLIPILIGIFSAVGGPCASYANSKLNPWLFPINCSVGETVEIRGRKETRKDAFINGNNSCKIKIVDSELTGPWIVKGGSNVELIVENSTLRVSKAVLENEGNSKVLLSHGSKVVTDDLVVSGANHMEVELIGSKIESKGGVAKAQNGPKVRAKEKSTITAAKLVIDGMHGELWLDASSLVVGTSIVRDGADYAKIIAANGSSIQGDGVPLQGGNSIELELTNSKLTGKQGGIEIGSHCKVRVLDGSSLTSAGDAIRTGDHTEIEVGQSSKVESQKTALRLASHCKVKVKGGSVSGVAAISAGNYTTVTFRKASIRGTQTTGEYSKTQEE